MPVDSGLYQRYEGLSAGALNADLVSMDVSDFKWLSLYIGTNPYSGTLTYQVSFDQVQWIGCLLYDQLSLDAGNSTYTTTAQGIIGHMPIFAPYFRVRMTSYTSGSAVGVLQLYKEPLGGFQLTTTYARLMPGSNNVGFVRNDGHATIAVAAGVTSDTVVAGGGMLVRVLITAAGTHSLTFYDNDSAASGKIVGYVPASPTVGAVYEFKMPVDLGIYLAGNSNNSGFTLSY